MSFEYEVFGLRVSSNHSIPGLVLLPPNGSPDVLVSLGAVPPEFLESPADSEIAWYESHQSNERGEPVLKVWKLKEGAYFRFLYHDGTEFFLDHSGTHVWAIWRGDLTLEDACVYLLGPVLGFVLRLRGILCLHASAVAIGNDAIALLGPGGAGKSTTAAAFANLGFPILADDLAALREEGGAFFVLPGYPRLCLWPESANALFGEHQNLPRIVANWEKRFLDLTDPGYRFQEEALRLRAIYLLGGRQENDATPAMESVSSQEGLVHLVGNTYANYLLDGSMRSQEFETLGQIVIDVPIRRVSPPKMPGLLPKMVDAIVSDFHELIPAGAGSSHLS